jgi:dihydropyrimidinase
MSENPAKIFGLFPRKGIIAPGSDADIVIFDPTLPHTIKAKSLHTKVDYSMYEGRECIGAPITVIQRGNIVLHGGEFQAKPGQGQYLPGNSNL